MLLSREKLEAIKSGDLSLVFRRWRRPTVTAGGTLKTGVGVLAIERLERIERREISARDAAAAGYDSRDELLSELDRRDGDLYRIEVRFAGADPRVRLREEDDLDDPELEEIEQRLARLDAASRTGDWTLATLRAIERHPHVAAARLARETGSEKDRLKRNVRKLKNLGLTISHQPGYELSPRGRVVLEYLDKS